MFIRTITGWPREICLQTIQSAENRRKECHPFWLRLHQAVILISNDRTSASKKINRMALIRTPWFYGFQHTVYGEKFVVNVNEARSAIFWKKLNKTSKVIYISLLPPCKSNLKKLHGTVQIF